MSEPVTRAARRAGEQDVAPLAQLINRAYEVEAEFTDSLRTSAGEVARLIDQGQFLVLDRVGGGLAATVYVAIDGQRGRFEMLSVAPDLQGRGLGRRLVTVAELLCRAEGCAEMEIEVINLREPLPRFYRSLGYQPAGTAPVDDPGLRRPAHFIRMAKSLD